MNFRFGTVQKNEEILTNKRRSCSRQQEEGGEI